MPGGFVSARGRLVFDVATNLLRSAVSLVPPRGRQALLDVAFGVVLCTLSLALLFLVIWGVVHAAHLDR
jgi:hypothetical protein